MSRRIVRLLQVSSLVKVLVFLIGLVLGTMLYLSAASSSAEKYRRMYESEWYAEASRKYNLLEERYDPPGERLMLSNNTVECSLDYANRNKLEQDHPCVIEIIKKQFLIPPPPPQVSLALNSLPIADHSLGKSAVILRFSNRTEGFFVDLGAGDGEFMSITLDLEVKRGWSGILIEPNQKKLEQLKSKKRKSWIVPACVSSAPYPDEAFFYVDPDSTETYRVQCFPLYSILLAAERTAFDFLNLNARGRELAILKTIPKYKVDTKLLAVNARNEKFAAITKFLENKADFTKVNDLSTQQWSNGLLFIKATD